MEITSFKISNDKATLLLNLSDAAAATNLYIWTDKTYKYENKKIDLSSKLNGSATQNISITLAELDLSFFDGVYFVDVVSPSVTLSAITAELTRYEECILDKVMEQSSCDSCQKVTNPSLVNTRATLDALQISIKHGFIDEILGIIKTLNKMCSDDCRSCGSYRNQRSGTYYSFNIVSE